MGRQEKDFHTFLNILIILFASGTIWVQATDFLGVDSAEYRLVGRKSPA